MLENYLSILNKKRYAGNHYCRCVQVPEDFDDVSREELEALHKEGMAELRRKLHEGGSFEKKEPSLLDVKAKKADEMLLFCNMCERRCGVNRKKEERGWCGVGSVSMLASQFLHMGEEDELIPSHTVFFSGCTFKCEYCQNWDIAMNPGTGLEIGKEKLAGIIDTGVRQGAGNLNLVGGNPDPNIHTVLGAIAVSRSMQHHPVIWNSNMYTSKESMMLLEGVVDIFLGDFRYGNDECARELSHVDGYIDVVGRNFKKAYKEAEVIVRHLVLPGHLDCCTAPIMEWSSLNMPDVYFNLMFQYRPEYRAASIERINRHLSDKEIKRALSLAGKFNINVR